MVCDKNAWCHNSEWLVGHFICSKSLLSIEWLSFPIIFAILCRVKFSINIPISSMHTQTYIYIQCHTYIGKFDKQTIPAKVQIHQIMKLKRQNQINNNNSIRFDINEQNGEWLEFVDCTVANNDRSIVCYLFKMCVCECVCVCARLFLRRMPASQPAESTFNVFFRLKIQLSQCIQRYTIHIRHGKTQRKYIFK